MKKLIFTAFVAAGVCMAFAGDMIGNGVQWHDQNNRPVSAHGANMIFDGGRYWLFGEYKTDSANIFTGFSRYSSDNLVDWHFEGMALETQPDGIMGPGRVGERPKVLRCPATGEYVMLMHSDNLRYKEPCVAYATSPTIDGTFTFRGPLLYKGKPVRRWDIGSFVDDDGHAYLLVHHGSIYRLAPDFHSLDSCMTEGVKGVGESPAMFHRGGLYYWLSSHTTSWESNDNVYHTAPSLSGPWTFRGNFAPEGTNTWNSQCSFVMTLPDGTPMYMGDRWSFPRQKTSATYVWLPLVIREDSILSLPVYTQFWNPATCSPADLNMRQISGSWEGKQPGDSTVVKFRGTRVAVSGVTDSLSGYADVIISDPSGRKVVDTWVNFYSLAPFEDVRYISPQLPEDDYTLVIRVSTMRPNWTDKKRIIYGSRGHRLRLTSVSLLP